MIRSSGLLTTNALLALFAAVLLFAAGGCDESRKLPKAHEWAAAPTKSLMRGDCARAVEELLAVPATDRDGIWWGLFEPSSMTCFRRTRDNRYKKAFLETAAAAEAAHPHDPALLYWFAMALEEFGSHSDARLKFTAAEHAALRMLTQSEDPDERKEAQNVLDNLAGNGMLGK